MVGLSKQVLQEAFESFDTNFTPGEREGDPDEPSGFVEEEDFGLALRRFQPQSLGVGRLSPNEIADLHKACVGRYYDFVDSLYREGPKGQAEKEMAGTMQSTKRTGTGNRSSNRDTNKAGAGSERPRLGKGPFDKNPHNRGKGPRIVKPLPWEKVPRLLQYKNCNSTVSPPSQWNPKDMTRSALEPKAKLSLAHVYGYRGTHDSANLFYIPGGGGGGGRKGSRNSKGGKGSRGGGGGRSELAYYTAAAGVVLDTHENTQRFFLGHDDEITCLTVDPSGRYIATGQLGKYPYVCVWTADKCEQVAEVGAIELPKAQVGSRLDSGKFH
jgi:hypothetical protein